MDYGKIEPATDAWWHTTTIPNLPCRPWTTGCRFESCAGCRDRFQLEGGRVILADNSSVDIVSRFLTQRCRFQGGGLGDRFCPPNLGSHVIENNGNANDVE